MDGNIRNYKTMEEKWLKIPGFSRYEASNTGKLRSLSYKLEKKIKEIKPALTRDGYLKTMLLRDDGKYCTHRVHWFVTLTWFGIRPDGHEVNHKNGDKTDNSVNNIEYVSHSYNVLHSFKMGLQKPKRGSLNGKAKLTEYDIKTIRLHAKNNPGRYYGRKAIAEKYGVSEAHIKDIVTCRRNIWPHISV